MEPRKKQRGLTLALSLLMLVAVVAMVWPREKRLMDRATLVTNHTNWDESNGYDWLSDHELLYMRTNQDSDTDEESKPRILRYDRNTGAETLLDPLTTQLVRSVDSADYLYLSPDRTHVLWNGKGDTTYVARLDGAGVQHYKQHDPKRSTTPLWLGDGRHWAEAIDDSDSGTLESIYLHALDDPAYHRLLRIEPHMPWNNANFSFMTNSLSGSMHLFGENSNPNKVTTTDEVIEMDLAVSAKPIHLYRVVFPMAVEVEEEGISQDGKRIAWILNATYEPPPLLRRLLPRQFKTQTTWSIWVSRTDGSEMNEIGHVRTTEDSPPDVLSLLDWLPDGKHLSFLYKDSLWTVPAE